MPPDFEPDEIPLPGEERRPPAQQAKPSPTQSSTPPAGPGRPPTPSAPPPRPPASTPPPRPLVSQPQSPPPRPKPSATQRPKTLEEIERERLARAGARQVQEPARPAPARSVPAKAPTKTKPIEQWEFSATPHAILNGVVWHQILAEPRSQYWRRVRKLKR
jgi:hypothetical protein